MTVVAMESCSGVASPNASLASVESVDRSGGVANPMRLLHGLCLGKLSPEEVLEKSLSCATSGAGVDGGSVDVAGVGVDGANVQ